MSLEAGGAMCRPNPAATLLVIIRPIIIIIIIIIIIKDICRIQVALLLQRGRAMLRVCQ